MTGRNPYNPYEDLLDDIDMDEEYQEDWYCGTCEQGPISTSIDKCPRCGAHYDEQYPEESHDEDGYPVEKYEEIY